MKEQLAYAVEILRCEFYRIAGVIRARSDENMQYNPNMHREQQRQIVEALLILGADITSDMEMLKESFRK